MTELTGESPGASGLAHQEALAELLDVIVDNIPIMLFVKDAAELRFQLWNKAGEELLGLTRRELLGKSDYDFFPRDQADHFTRKDREVLSGRRLSAVEEPIRGRFGDRLLYTRKIPILDERGEPRFLLGISQDITEQKRSEHALSEAKEIAEAANRAKSELIATISHELRTPLTLILGPLDTLLARGPYEPEVATVLSRMRRNAGRLSHLVNDLLDLTKLEAGKVEVEWRAVRVTELCEHVLEDAQPAASARGITLGWETDGQVDYAPLDRRMFEKILINLIGNALKFTESGGRVDVAVRADGDSFELSVADTGIGIPDEKMNLLFQRFRQLDGSSTRRYEGSGLGLSLVKELTERMGGAVAVESREGEGSRFWVRLPRDPDRVSALMRAPRDDRAEASTRRAIANFDDVPVPSTPSPPMSGIRPRLILAENNGDMRAHVAELLSDEYDVIAVEDGREALDAARACPPDVVVSDVMMPEMDGMTLVRALREDEALRAVPVLLLTARVGHEALAAGLDGGADDYIEKPFSPIELRARLRAARRIHKLRTQLLRTVNELTETRRELSAAVRREAAIRDAIGDIASQLRERPGQDDLAALLSKTG